MLNNRIEIWKPPLTDYEHLSSLHFFLPVTIRRILSLKRVKNNTYAIEKPTMNPIITSALEFKCIIFGQTLINILINFFYLKVKHT